MMEEKNYVTKTEDPGRENTRDIRSFTKDELCEYIEGLGEKKYRADQVFSWLHDKCVSSFFDMKNVPKSLIEKMSEQTTIRSVAIEECLISQCDGTRKYLMRLFDGNIVECVLMPYEYGNSICISSQVGCRMGCRFCASTIDGLVRNLSAGEMVGQIYSVAADIQDKISHVVIMGSGEPFDNYDALVDFIRIITDEKGQNLSGRNITVSTCGIVPKIYEFAKNRFQLTLAVSLHAVTDEKRRNIMPVANKYTIDEILTACEDYFLKTGRRITFEYSLISGVNDSKEDAALLSEHASRVGAHVNLIPVNPISERKYVSTAKEGVFAFKNKLEKNGINVTIRREMGRDIQGACGQLRRSYIKKEVKDNMTDKTRYEGEESC